MVFGSFVLLLALPLAHGYAMGGPACQVFLSDEGVAEEICAIHYVVGPVPDGPPDFEDSYEILELPADGSITEDDLDEMGSNYTNYLAGIDVNVTRFADGSCEVFLNGDECANCEICGENSTATSISVDCSIVPTGRVVECESVDFVFFPLQGYTFAAPGGEVSDNPPSTSDGEVSDSPPSDSASPQSSSSMAFVIACSLLVAVGTILNL